MNENIKTIYTDDKTERAIISQRADGLFSVSFEKFIQACNDEEDYQYEYWGRSNNTIHLFDTIEHAICSVMSEPPFKYNESSEVNSQ